MIVTFPKVDCTNLHALKNHVKLLFTLTLLHVINDWGFDTLKMNLEVLYTIIILESGFRLIHMNISPLDPLEPHVLW